MTIYTSDTRGNRQNCLYPNKKEIASSAMLEDAVSHDYVTAAYKDSRRSIENFLSSDCLSFDIDNEHSEAKEEWITPADIASTFPGAEFFVHYSRNHNKSKNGKAPRPKFHVLFPIPVCTDASLYAAMKQAMFSVFPYFDAQALDAARFFFGTEACCAEHFPGAGTIMDYLPRLPLQCGDAGNIQQSVPESAPISAETAPPAAVIPRGERNSTMHRYATRVLKRYGIGERAYALFMQESEKCDPPLSARELGNIWYSASRFFKRIADTPDYIPPGEYTDPFGPRSLRPEDYSDIGQAKMLVREYRSELIYTDNTDFLRYNGQYWVESRQKAVGAMEEFLDLQLANAEDQIKAAVQELVALGAEEKDISSGGRRFAQSLETPELQKAYSRYCGALAYHAFVMKHRDMRYVISALQAAKPMLQHDISALDKDCFLLNTPAGTYDLRIGLSSLRPHRPEDLITKITSCAPGDRGKQEWLNALDTFFCADQALIDYVQQIAGLAAVGKVFLEAIIIAYGEGRNGKSTFWNTIARVLGSYSGRISADTLTVGCKRNVKPEMAELKGKRLIIAAELEEGMRLNTSMIKQLCSTDDVFAEKKYKDPFSYTPNHTLVLYTNHLPRVGASDEGTWRRLIVIPFNAKLTGSGDRKNYTDFLVENASEYILKWIIEGAVRVINNSFRIQYPECVKRAIKAYRDNNDWLGSFLDDCCETGSEYTEKSGKVYQEYRNHCIRSGEYARNTTDFYAALDSAGFERKRTKSHVIINGLKLKSNGNCF